MAIDLEMQTDLPSTDRRPAHLAGESSPAQSSGRAGVWWKRGLLAAGILVALAAGGFALLRTVAPPAATSLLTHTITRGNLVVSVTEQGTLESSSNKEIKCKVKGASTVLWVIETGTEVQAGDVLVRLDTSTIEDNINQQKIAYENALANKTTAASDVAVAQISITEYLEGTYKSELATKERELVIAESSLKTALNTNDYAQRMFRKGYISQLELETNEDAVKHAELEVKVKRTDLEVLEKFTRAKTLQELESLLDVAEARLGAYSAALDLERARLAREEEQLKNCTILADVAGMVIYPSAAEWKEQPDIEEGAVVREDQVLLMIPDLKQMQVKIGIHESKVDRMKLGMKARIELQDGFVEGTVHSVASITKPTGWWNGNVVKYDTVIKLDAQTTGLKPGMSVAVEVFLARYDDVLTIPVAAVMQQERQFSCWVASGGEVARRGLTLGDSNDQFIVVESGLQEGDRVVLNPLDFVDEAQREALKPVDETGNEEEPGDASPGAPNDDAGAGGQAEAGGEAEADAGTTGDKQDPRGAAGGKAKPAKAAGKQPLADSAGKRAANAEADAAGKN